VALRTSDASIENPASHEIDNSQGSILIRKTFASLTRSISLFVNLVYRPTVSQVDTMACNGLQFLEKELSKMKHCTSRVRKAVNYLGKN